MNAVSRIFPDLPARMSHLPLSEKGFPIPYFAAETSRGVRDFRVVDPVQMRHAIKHRKCWVCGGQLGKYMAFVIGPMCAINRTISDPPSHRECAIFSARNCPFLSRPLAKRRTTDLPEQGTEAAGFGLKRNPGACGVWISTSYRVFRAHAGARGILFEMGTPEEVLWFSNGREATRAEVQHSVDTGLPSLIELAELDGPEGMAELDRRRVAFEKLLPA